MILQRLRIAQIICDLLFNLRLRHHRIQRWLGTAVGVWPDSMTPVNVFDCSLVRDTLNEGQGSVRAEAGVILRRENLGILLR